MKRRRILPLFLAVILVISAVPTAFAYEAGEPCTIDLSSFIHDREKREYVEMMVDHHIRTDRDIQNALDGGFSAVFLFDGCSDHMNDPELSNLSYYRVSGICLVVNRNAAGELKLAYFNDDASTIPDQPLKYGAWTIPEVGEVGPATICDGTYQLYSILHRGEYEALHVRSDFRDGTLEAIYLTPDGGHTSYRASEINVHTRTSNHIANYGMWSAGCPLVGDGNALEYSSLIRCTYYTSYDSFEVMNFVGTLTIDRQMLRQELYTLYKNPDAVFHTDAVQGFLKIPFAAKTLGADLISVSSHKIHGPKGVGALYISPRLKSFPAFLMGGGQESNLRSGTEGTPAIFGFAAACTAMAATCKEDIRAEKELLNGLAEKLAPLDGVRINGSHEAPHVLSIAVPGVPTQNSINILQDHGICVSAGSACAKGHRSHVLEAMKVPPEAINGTFRVSICRDTTAEELDALYQIIQNKILPRVR